MVPRGANGASDNLTETKGSRLIACRNESIPLFISKRSRTISVRHARHVSRRERKSESV